MTFAAQVEAASGLVLVGFRVIGLIGLTWTPKVCGIIASYTYFWGFRSGYFGLEN